MTSIITRDFVQNFAKHKHTKEPIFIKDRSKTVGVYVSLEEWENKTKHQKPRRMKREDMAQFQTSTGITDLSNTVDDIYQ